jgi:hypothetical protein
MQVLSRRRAATRELIAAPWTPLASLCCRRASNARGSGWCTKADRHTRYAPCQMEDGILEKQNKRA